MIRPAPLCRALASILCAATCVRFAIADPAVPREPSAGTREMAALLQECASKVDPSRLSFIVNEQRPALMEAAFRKARGFNAKLELRYQLGIELVNAGRNEEGLLALDALEQDALQYAPGLWASNGTNALLVKATAHLRMGEEQNCCLRNNRDSCLLPIGGAGVHREREGSSRAVDALLAILEREPGSLLARWLLNLAHMTLGTYPDGVPAPHLIPPSAFASEYPLPRFNNVSKDVGLDVYGLAGGAVLEDFDNDGRLDLMVSAIGLNDQTQLFRNPGGGAFENRTQGSGLIGEVGGLNMIQADYDNDGFVDVLVLRGGWMARDGRFPMSLLRNKGDGTFDDVTKAAGLIRFAPTQTATWFDYDGDGWLDVFVGNESAPDDPYPCHLFHSNRDGTFTDVAMDAGVDFIGFVKGVTSGDYDNDGRPDLYLSLGSGENVLFHNDGPAKPGGQAWGFTNVARAAGVTEPHASFGTFFFDYDNDGWQDLFVTGYGGFVNQAGLAESVAADYLGLPTTGERGRLYHNRGNGTFEDVTKAAGLYRVVPAMGLNFGDLDNDGLLDMYLGTGNPALGSLAPNRMFRNADGRTFQDVTTAGNFGHLQKGHAVVFGDIDNDGDMDVFEEMGGAYSCDKAYSALYENPGTTNRWIGLDLEGVRSNRKAIGARVEVVVETKDGLRSLHRVVSSGASFGGSPFRQHIGIGDARRVRTVKIFWPMTGETQTLSGLEPGRWYRVREGVSQARALDWPKFSLTGGTDTMDRALTRVSGRGK
jgi:hypothetical protein